MATDNQALLLQVSADIRGLQKQFDKAQGIVDKGSKAMERRAQQSATSLERFFGKTDPGKALDKVFDSTRFKILDTGVARVGLFGSALESLGPIGLGVAATFATVAVAVSQALSAMTFGDEIGDTAAKLQVSTKTLQEYRYAIHAVGGETSDADAAFASFQETLGRAEAGMPKALKWFKALGFTQEQLRSFSSTDEAIQAVMDRIGKLPDASQRAAAAAAVGLTGMIPAISQGSEKFDELRQSAERLGYVLDNDTIQKLSDAKDQMEDASHIIKTQLAAAFSGTAVDIANAMTMLSQWLATLRQVSQEAPGLFGAIRAAAGIMTLNPYAIAGGINDIRHSGQDRADPHAGPVTSANMRSFFGIAAPGGGADLTLPTKDNSAAKAAQQLKHFNDMMAKDAEAILATMDNERHSAEERADIARKRLDAEEIARKQELKDLVQTKAITPKQAKDLGKEDADVFKKKRAELDAQLSAELESVQLKAQQDLATSSVSLLRSRAAMATTAAERAKLEAEALAQEQKQARDDLKFKLDHDPNKSSDQKTTETNNLLAQQANDTAKQQADAANAVADEALSVQTANLDAQTDMLNALLAIARTAAARRDLELKLLDVADARLKAELEGVLASQTATDAEKQIAQKKLDELSASRPAREQNVRDQTNGPFAAWVDALPKIDDLNERMQSLAVEGIEGLNSVIGELASRSGKASDILHNFLKQLLADALQLSLQRTEGAIFSHVKIPGFASGTDFAPGGLAIVGEKGPELVNLPRGARVSPNFKMPAVASYRLPDMGSVARGAPTVIVQAPIHLHAEGAIMTAELMRGLSRQAEATKRAAVSEAIRSMPAAQRRYGKLGSLS
jgi:hypothetical protein